MRLGNHSRQELPPSLLQLRDQERHGVNSAAVFNAFQFLTPTKEHGMTKREAEAVAISPSSKTTAAAKTKGYTTSAEIPKRRLSMLSPKRVAPFIKVIGIGMT